MTSTDPRAWVLAVDARPPAPAAGTTLARTATADAGGVRVGVASPDIFDALVRELGAGHAGVAPAAVVVVHPASWDDARSAGAADDVGAAVGRAVGADAAEWPWPVPLSALEAGAWRALEYGLLPARARVVVVDGQVGEAGVVDREHEQLVATGRPRALTAPGTPEQLVALARQVLDDAPPGPPFAGVVVGGASPGGDAALAGVVARVTGRPALLAGDPATVALLGAASLGWAVVSASGDGTPRPRQAAGRGTPDGGSTGGSGGRASARPAGRPAARPVDAAAAGPVALPGGRSRRRLPRWARWVLPMVVLAVVAGVAGLLVHRERSAPSPFTYTCPGGQVVAFRYECDRLAPSSSAP